MSFELPPEQTGAAAWYGPEIAKRDDWMMPLGAPEVAEIEAATRALVARDADIAVLKPRDFPLPTLGARLRAPAATRAAHAGPETSSAVRADQRIRVTIRKSR